MNASPVPLSDKRAVQQAVGQRMAIKHRGRAEKWARI
jgi:hypothetical protein